MPKSIWKFGKNWAYITPSGKRGLAKTRTEAAKKAGTKKRKASTKKPSRTRRAARKVKTVAKRRRSYTRKRRRSGARAMSFNLAKIGALGYVAYKMFGGLSTSNLGLATAGQVGENFKANWKEILGLSLGVALLGRVAGRYAPKAGIPGAISVKAF